MKPLFLLLSLYCLPHNLHAEEIEHIEVIDTNESFNLNTLIINRAELEQSYSQLSDVLAGLPGVQIRRNTGVGTRAQISIRGSNSQQVNLYIDGQLVNSGQYGNFDLDQLPIALIESVEVNQSQSSGAGATPIGGEIHITTIKPEGNKTSALLSLGTLGYVEANVKTNIKLNKQQQLLASVHYLKSDNDYQYLVPQPFYNPQYPETQALQNNDFKKWTAFINHDWDYGFGESNLSLQYSQQDKNIPNYQNNTPENNSVLETQKYQISNQQRLSLPWKYANNLYLNLSLSEQQETYRELPSLIVNNLYQYQTQQAYLAVKLPVSYQNWLWQPFVNYDLQIFESESLINQQAPTCNGIGACDVKAQRDNINYGQKLSWQLPKQNISVNWTLSNTISSNTNQSLYVAQADALTTDKHFFSQELDFQKHWGKHKLSLQATQGIRQPTMFELFGDRGLLKGNDNLQAEDSTGFSISGLHQFNSITLDQSLYRQRISNAIIAIYASSGTGSYQNVASVDLLGISSNIKWQVNTAWQTGFTLDLIDSNTESPIRAFNNKHQPGVYHKELDVYLHWKLTDKWWIKFNHYIGTDLYYDRANKITSNNGLTSEKHSSTLSVNYAFERFNLNGQITNLFDTSFNDLSNRPSQGRQLKLTLTIKEF